MSNEKSAILPIRYGGRLRRCVAVHSCETPRCRLCGCRKRRRLRRSDGRGGLVAMALDDPGLVVDLLEPVQRHAQLLDGVEAADPQQVLLKGPDEALDTAVALGLAHESRRALDAEEGELALVVVGDELIAVVVAELQAASVPPAKPPKAVRTPWRSGSSASKRVARRAA